MVRSNIGLVRGLGRTALIAAMAGGVIGAAAPELEREAAFVAENARAMDRMMFAMDIPTTGDADRDFVAMMVPHHQAAIDMARTQLKYGRNETLRRLAQEIVVAQGQEIKVMRLAIGDSASEQTAPAGGR